MTRPPCTRWTAAVIERGTGAPLWAVPMAGTQVSLERRWSTTSTSQITFSGVAADYACQFLKEHPHPEWATELAFFPETSQGGLAVEPWWVGPIVGVLTDPDTPDLVLRAYDRTAWWAGPADGERTVLGLEVNLGDNTGYAGELWDLYYAEANAIDPDGLTVTRNDPGARARLTVTTRFGDPIRDTLDDLTELGTNWTAAGRRLFVGSETWPRGPDLRGADWVAGDFPYTSDGFAMANFVTVRNPDGTIVATSPTDPAQALAAAGPAGLHMKTIEVEIESVDDAQQIADSYRAEHTTPRRWATTNDGSIAEGSALTLDEMICGRELRVTTEPSGCAPLDQLQRLTAVDVRVDDGETTQIQIATASSPPQFEERVI